MTEHENRKKNEIEKALQLVRADARERERWHIEQLGVKPVYGWSQDKHICYHRHFAHEANVVAHYCFVRMMQIDPD
jgi:hypothetical protein